LHHLKRTEEGRNRREPDAIGRVIVRLLPVLRRSGFVQDRHDRGDGEWTDQGIDQALVPEQVSEMI